MPQEDERLGPIFSNVILESIGTGVACAVDVVPFPRLPDVSVPQHYPNPFARTPHVTVFIVPMCFQSV